MATPRSSSTPNATPLLGRDALVAFGVIAACSVLVFALTLIARDAPSAGRSVVVSIPTPAVSTDGGCENFAAFWTDPAGAGLAAATIEGMTNCRRAADGRWFVPTGPGDDRLVAPPSLPAGTEAEAAAARQTLQAQLAALESTFPNTLQRWLSQIYDPTERAVVGHLRDGYSIRTARGRYTRLVQAYLLDPAHQPLADYVGWVMGRRIAAYDALNARCQNDPSLAYLRNACNGLGDNLSIRYPPFPWDLRDRLTMETYLAATIDPPSPENPVS